MRIFLTTTKAISFLSYLAGMHLLSRNDEIENQILHLSFHRICVVNALLSSLSLQKVRTHIIST